MPSTSRHRLLSPVSRQPLVREVEAAGFRVIRGFVVPEPAPQILEHFLDKTRQALFVRQRRVRQQALDDAAASAGWLSAQPPVERIAMIGFSAGGHLSYLAACQLPISRTAVLYGGWLPTTDIPMSRPSPTLDLTPGIRGRLLYLVGDDDALIDAGQRRQIGDALHAAGIDHELVSYPAVAHAFFWPGTPAFSRPARDDAWARILTLLAS